jgi:hypothetical protein
MFIVLEIRPLEHYMRPARGLRAVGHRWMDELCDSTLDSQRGTAYGSIAPRAALIATFPPRAVTAISGVYRQLQPRALLLARPRGPRD